MQVADGVFRSSEGANAYLLRSGREGILVDVGSGAILDQLATYGVDRVTDVLVTHHHRDGVQGLARAVAAGARVWVPATERDLFDRVDEHWQMRSIDNNYDLREDRFSLLESVPIAGVVEDYRTRQFGGFRVLTLPTPGHTPGSVSYVIETGGRRLAFTGDLIAAAGEVHSLAATQWTYTGIEGLGGTILSGLQVLDREPDMLLPAHGDPIEDPAPAIALLNDRLQRLIDLRSPEWRPVDLRARPYLEISRHLLRNRTSVSNSYVLLSDSGAALLIDYGYDFTTGLPSGADRSSRRPWLETLPALKAQFGVDRVEVAIPTHYHDDHVAGFNILRDVEGTQVWAPENMAPMLETPLRYDLPCLWYDPIPVDRRLPFGRPFQWHEYEITVHELPGHTLYAAAIETVVDGARIVATGDQQDGRWVSSERVEFLNYEYRNGFRPGDFRRSAELYRRIQPDLLISGHWLPRPVTTEYLDELLRAGTELEQLHHELLALDRFDPGPFGVGRVEPYRSEVAPGSVVELEVIVRNPLPSPSSASVELALPAGWVADPAARRIDRLASGDERVVTFRVQTGDRPVRRARIGADVTVGERRLGQVAEALVTLR